MKKTTLLLLLSVFLLCACDIDIYRQDNYTELYLVECFMIANESFPPLILSRTAPIGEPFVYQDQVINDASVHIFELDASGSRVAHHAYRQESTPGVYIPSVSGAKVKPATRYLLEITDLPAQGALIKAETFVPQSFEIIKVSRDSLPYQSSEQFSFHMTRSSYPGRQNVYIFTAEALDTVNYQLTPLYAEFAEDEDLSIVSSPIINEANYGINDDGTISIRLPWLMVAYYGPNMISAYAVDDNIYDFYRSADFQTGGILAPGHIENVIMHIEGGIGLFGSMAGVRSEIFVIPGN